MTDWLRERTLEMVEDGLERGLKGTETIDSIDFYLAIIQTAVGPQLQGLLFISARGTLVGTVVSNTDVIADLGALRNQDFVDARVRVCIAEIGRQKAALLAQANGASMARSN